MAFERNISENLKAKWEIQTHRIFIATSMRSSATSSPAMSTLSILSLPHTNAFSPNKNLPFLHPKTPIQSIGLGFCRLKRLRTSPQFPSSYKFPRSLFPSENQLSDAEEEDDDDDEAADEYEDVSGEVSVDDEQSDDEFEGSEDDDPEPKSRFEEFKWQRVERLRNEVREYGAEIIDVDELASI